MTARARASSVGRGFGVGGSSAYRESLECTERSSRPEDSFAWMVALDLAPGAQRRARGPQRERCSRRRRRESGTVTSVTAYGQVESNHEAPRKIERRFRVGRVGRPAEANEGWAGEKGGERVERLFRRAELGTIQERGDKKKERKKIAIKKERADAAGSKLQRLGLALAEVGGGGRSVLVVATISGDGAEGGQAGLAAVASGAETESREIRRRR